MLQHNQVSLIYSQSKFTVISIKLGVRQQKAVNECKRFAIIVILIELKITIYTLND